MHAFALAVFQNRVIFQCLCIPTFPEWPILSWLITKMVFAYIILFTKCSIRQSHGAVTTVSLLSNMRCDKRVLCLAGFAQLRTVSAAIRRNGIIIIITSYDILINTRNIYNDIVRLMKLSVDSCKYIPT